MAEVSKSVRILLADDHPIFRDGLRKLLETQADFEVVGEASDGVEAVKMARELDPDVLLLDLAMPRRPGLGALQDLADLTSRIRVILLTAGIEKPQILEALHRGARGVVTKESATELLLKCIRTVMAGEYWVGRESVADLVRFLRAPEAGRSDDPARFRLTPREIEVVGAIVAGDTNRDIARRLSISEDTVKHHLTNIFDKLGVSNRLELALFAVSHRLVEPD
jgi:DNA-binding NarL/FixJ family response regulator